MTSPFTSRLLRIAAVLGFVILSAGVNMRYAHDKIIATEDNLLMYMTAHVFMDAGRLDSVFERFMHHVRDEGYDEETIKHYQLRIGNVDNYLLHAAAYRLSRALLGPPPSGNAYAHYVYESLRLGSHLALLAVLAVSAVVLGHLRDGRQATAVLAVSLVMIAITATNLVPRPHWRIGGYAELSEFLWAIGMFFLDTGGGWSPWGPPARSAMTMLLFPLFALRWSGRFAWAYVILFVACFAHQTYAGIMLMALLTVDAVVRPRIFVHPGVVAAATATLAMFLGREIIWDIFAGPWLPLGLLAVIGTAGGLSLAARRVPRLGHFLLITRLAEMRTMTADMVLLATGMAGLLATSWVMSRLDHSLTGLFVWQEMAARPLALVKIPIVTGLAIMVLDILARRKAGSLRIVRAVVVALSLIAVAGGTIQYVTVHRTGGAANTTATAFADHVNATWNVWTADPSRRLIEEVAFLAMNRELDLRDGSLAALLDPREKDPR